jgi:predicted metalloprotease with PDZ domain
LQSPRQFQAYLGGQYGRQIPVIVERGGQRFSMNLASSQPSSDGPWLGVYLQENDDNQRGARITNVFPSGPAARAGLRRGDIVLQANGQEIASAADLIATVDSFKPNDRVEFTVQRNDQQLTIPTTLGDRETFVHFRQDGDYARYDSGDDDFADIPAHAMGLEHDRRMAEQHQRIESELIKLQNEVRELRQLLEQKTNN